MDDALQKLLDAALTGDDTAVMKLGRALRSRCKKTPSLLAEFAASEEPTMRRAAIVAIAGREDREALSLAERFVADSDPDVRRQIAIAMTEVVTWPLEHLCKRLLDDVNVDVRRNALDAARARPSLSTALVDRLQREPEHWLKENIAHALAAGDPMVALPALTSLVEKESDFNLRAVCADSIEQLLSKTGSYPKELESPSQAALMSLQRLTEENSFVSHTRLKKWLKCELESNVDVRRLTKYGTLISQDALEGRLPRAYLIDEHVDSLLSLLRGDAPRAVVLLGESGTGKTALVQELVHVLAREPENPWFTLSMSPTDFMTGTKYLGEWETKVQEIVDAIRAPKPVLLYVPNFEDLAWVGTSDKSDANVAAALAPFIERGEITIIGETTTEGFRKAIGSNRHLSSLFHLVELRPAGAERTRAIAERVIAEAEANVEPDVVERLCELGEYFGGVTVEPGRSIGLLRRVIGADVKRSGPITSKEMLVTISKSTGIPVDFLDDQVALERSAVRSFFESRVMGQSEAVGAVVDLVTLIKAGLTDPARPLGVLLFVGPTGVGKTELARALAERLFGDPGSLVRLDMSEYATYEAFERLIGPSWKGTEPGILTSAVREKPFSVLLFDEIEKAHPNIYNLCLQMFDAARLTDSHGRTASFRQSIIILTSNVGAKDPGEGVVGFSRDPSAAADQQLHLKELERWFRPEFLNRLDRIVVFRALTMETAEKIARREVKRVLERSGISRRRLAIDVEPEVYPLILREGYSPTFGARPLKRTVERMILLPVAKVIAAGKAPSGALVRLVARDSGVAIEVESSEPVKSKGAVVLRTGSVRSRLDELIAGVQALVEGTDSLAERKSELLSRSTTPGFWDDGQRSKQLMDEIYRVDGVLEQHAQLEQEVSSASEYLEAHRGIRSAVVEIEKRLGSFEKKLDHVSFLVKCRDPLNMGDALLTASLATVQGDALGGVQLIAQMYHRLAVRRGLEVEIISDFKEADSHDDFISLLISGAGAFALLANEAGLHQLTKRREGGAREVTERREALDGHLSRDGRDVQKKVGRPVNREVVRVEVLPLPTGEDELREDELQKEIKDLQSCTGRLITRPKVDIQLFHQPSLTAVRLRSGSSRTDALSQARLLLRARLTASDMVQELSSKAAIIRRYRLGPNALVKDSRTGLQTGRLNKVLDGELDLFLQPRHDGRAPESL